MSEDNANTPQGGGRSLGGGAAEPLPSNWAQPTTQPRVGRVGEWGGSGSSSSRSVRPSGNGPRIGTLSDIASSGSGRGPAPPDDDSDDEEGGRQQENWFTGGERSGLSVQNPNADRSSVPGGRMVRDLLRRAAEGGVAPAPQSGARSFFGGGHTLGSADENIASQHIPDPSAQRESESAIRHLTFWRDGFTVEDGELMRYDDPENSTILAELNAGRAPPSILNVEDGQHVELRVSRRITEDYVPPAGIRTFTGSGNRLGNPVPQFVSGGAPIMPGSFSEAGSSSTPVGGVEPDSVTPKFEVDQSQPTTSVQIRLADGTKMACRMNLTHTVLDLRNFINASRPENLIRAYTIGTTFPKRTLDDNSQTIEAAGLKNSVVVQRWV